MSPKPLRWPTYPCLPPHPPPPIPCPSVPLSVRPSIPRRSLSFCPPRVLEREGHPPLPFSRRAPSPSRLSLPWRPSPRPWRPSPWHLGCSIPGAGICRAAGAGAAGAGRRERPREVQDGRQGMSIVHHRSWPGLTAPLGSGGGGGPGRARRLLGAGTVGASTGHWPRTRSHSPAWGLAAAGVGKEVAKVGRSSVAGRYRAAGVPRWDRNPAGCASLWDGVQWGGHPPGAGLPPEPGWESPWDRFSPGISIPWGWAYPQGEHPPGRAHPRTGFPPGQMPPPDGHPPGTRLPLGWAPPNHTGPGTHWDRAGRSAGMQTLSPINSITGDTAGPRQNPAPGEGARTWPCLGTPGPASASPREGSRSLGCPGLKPGTSRGPGECASKAAG